MFAPIYEAFTARGIAASVVDGMEIWQIAASLGTGSEPADVAGKDRALFLQRERLAGRKPKVRAAGSAVGTMLSTLATGGEV